MTDTSKYGADEIQVLKGLEAVRRRPAMYIGDTGKRGIHHCVKETIDNSVDEAMAGHCTEINVVLFKDGETISIEDDGRGIPVEIHSGEKKSSLEVVMTILHAGGKFDESGEGGYKVSGGLHGVGVSCVNAVSAHLKAEVWRDGGLWVQEYEKGIPLKKVAKIADLGKRDKQHGTRITFRLDREIFKEGNKFDPVTLANRFRETSFLNRGLKITFENEIAGTKEEFKSDAGIADYVRYMTEARTGHYPADPIHVVVETDLTTRKGKIQVEAALNYTAEDEEVLLSFANNIHNPDGGTHEKGFKTALTRVVNQFARSLGYIKEKDTSLQGDDVREGLTGIISVKFPQAEFVGQTKDRLATGEVEGIVSSTMLDALNTFFDKNAAVIKKIVERALLAQEARDAAKKSANLIKRGGLFGKTSKMPTKLIDCNSENMEDSELFIVEGDSAAGSGKRGRDPETQALLPIRGKIINAEKKDIVKLTGNKEILAIIKACGTGILEEFDIEKLRYNKVIIMSDADDDGAHIATLLITFFYRYMKPLVTGGHLYIAQPPLFRVGTDKNAVYCFSKEEMEAETKKQGAKAKTTRFKGLGEMNADELGITTMNPIKRKLIKITTEDAGEAERILTVLLGSNVPARKAHISSQVNSSASGSTSVLAS